MVFNKGPSLLKDGLPTKVHLSILVILQNELKRFQEVQIPSYLLRPTKLGFTEVKTRNIFFKALLMQLVPKPEFGHHSLGIAIVK